MLYSHIKNRLTNFKECFPVNNRKVDNESVKIMMNTLENLVKLDIIVRVKPGSDVDATKMTIRIAQQCIEKSIIIEYNAMLMRTEKVLNESHKNSIINPVDEYKLMLLCDMIDEELFDTLPHYMDAFDRYFQLEIFNLKF